MKNRTAIIGTAGHIDHGKTALVRAMTGFDCDTHRQEKERGITISLGFTRLDLPDGRRVGIIDCPGHRDFIHTMVAGSSGIDLALVTVDAVEGVMPQTVEHLRILDLLGVTHRIFAITRSDLTSREACGDLQAQLERDFPYPVVITSAVTGEGIDCLLSAIQESIPESAPADPSVVFRMPIDRIFTLKGHGIVVGGTVRSGVLKMPDPVYLLPGGEMLRVRRMEYFGEQVEAIGAGQRAALNLTGVKREELQLGMQLGGAQIAATARIDAILHLFKDAGRLGIWSRALFLQNGVRYPAAIHLLDRDTLLPDQHAVVQIDLEHPHVCIYGEPFVLRDSSNTFTIGGGTVLDPHPQHHRRRRQHQIDALIELAGGGAEDFIAQKVNTCRGLFDADKFARENGFPPCFVKRILDDHPQILCVDQKNSYLSQKIFRKIEKTMIAKLGRDRTASTIDLTAGTPEYGYVLQELHEKGRVWEHEGKWFLPVDREVLELACDCLTKYMLREEREIAIKHGIVREMSEKGIDEYQLRLALDCLLQKGEIVLHRDRYFHRALLESSRAIMRKLRRFTVREFRDLKGCSRGTAIAILEYFDETGETVRENDVRFIRDYSN